MPSNVVDELIEKLLLKTSRTDSNDVENLSGGKNSGDESDLSAAESSNGGADPNDGADSRSEGNHSQSEGP